MTNDNSPLEGMLRDSLGRQADRGMGTGPDLGNVLGRAKVIRRRRRQGAAVAAAAVVVAIAVPSALLLNGSPKADAPVVPTHSGDASAVPSQTTKASESPTEATKAPSRSSSPAHTATAFASLAAIPRGADATVTYLDGDGVVHSYDGQTTRLPKGAGTVQEFHEFRGGWVVANSDSRLIQYDANGNVVRTTHDGGQSSIVTSSDNTSLAWQSGRTVFYGVDNTMGNGGPSKVTAPAAQVLIGFLPYGPALTGDGDKLTTMTNSGKFETRTIGLYPESTAQTANLVGGSIGRVPDSDYQGAVYDLTTHTMLWHNKWNPVAFSPDGKYVAGYPIYDNGGPSTWAILNARTGAVVAQTPKLKGIYLGLTATWQDDHTLVFTGTQGTASSAMLTLTTDGAFRRASDTVPADSEGAAPFLFAAQP